MKRTLDLKRELNILCWTNLDLLWNFVRFISFLAGRDVSQIEQFLEEALTMEQFKHPNIIRILGVTFKDDTPYVILRLWRTVILEHMWRKPAM